MTPPLGAAFFFADDGFGPLMSRRQKRVSLPRTPHGPRFEPIETRPMTYTITSYVSVNAFVFGQTRTQIGKTSGKPLVVTTDNIQGIVTEQREGCDLVFEDKRLAYVTLNKHVTPVVEGIEVYADGALEALKALDPDHLIGPRYIVFRTLGLCVGGLSRKKIPEGRIVSAFATDKREFFEFFVED